MENPTSRREFLKATAGVVTAGAVATTLTEIPAAAAADTAQAAGYRDSAHVRKFYELARF